MMKKEQSTIAESSL